MNLIETVKFRVVKAICTVPSWRDWAAIAGLLLLYSVIYLPIGFGTGFLKVAVRPDAIAPVLIGALISPALSEEFVFRVLLIPHKFEKPGIPWLSILLSGVAFIVYHPLNPFGEPFFADWVFLTGAALLGVICTIAYLLSGSYWAPVLIHWVIVVCWLILLGGLERFQ